MRRIALCVVLLAAVALLCGTAEACPMCKVATETDARLPRAYMYSILFMLAMPATVFVGFSYGLWRLSRRERRVADEIEQFAGASHPEVFSPELRERPSSSEASGPDS